MSAIDLSAICKLPKRGDKLFFIFARFEFALKKANFVIAKGKDDAVQADWDSFANKGLGPEFFYKVTRQKIAQTILERPPSKQIISDGDIDWQSTLPPTDIQTLIGAVCRVRNNLFHGGKSGDIDAERNDKLIEESIAILLWALEACEDVRWPFEGKY